jgi:FKBP-type peptidyl-prolyl cis-trans isomerase FkpA
MKYYLLTIFSFLLMLSAKAADKDSTVYYNLPDSVKAVQFMAEVGVHTYNYSGKRYFNAGIKTDVVSLSLTSYKKEKIIRFSFPAGSQIMAQGLIGKSNPKRQIDFSYTWELNTTYKLLIATASDSAENFSLYSGYVFLTKENKWKLIGTCKINGRWNTIEQPSVFYSNSWENIASVTIGQVWCQRQNGSWKNLKDESQSWPVINLFGHIDSIAQHVAEQIEISKAIVAGKTDAKNIEQGVYYTMIKEGTGRQVSINDTVTVLYKLTLLNDGSLVTETKTKPDTFSLKRLIRGWQIGVPLCKVGGKIKLVIPSDLGYSIRTRAAKIPPNSVLVFEIEVLDAKSPN